jgi:hypothetical protein
MNTTLIDLTERLVPVSDFSQGKAGKIFTDVYENNMEYIVKIIEDVENIRLLQLANERSNIPTTSFEEIVTKEGYTMDEIKKLSESVEIE